MGPANTSDGARSCTARGDARSSPNRYAVVATSSGMELTLHHFADGSAKDRGLSPRSPVVAEEQARENLAKTVAELQTALNWEEERLEEEQIMLDRYALPPQQSERHPEPTTLLLAETSFICAMLKRSTRHSWLEPPKLRRPRVDRPAKASSSELTIDTHWMLADTLCTAAPRHTTTRYLLASAFFKAASSPSLTTSSPTTHPTPCLTRSARRRLQRRARRLQRACVRPFGGSRTRGPTLICAGPAVLRSAGVFTIQQRRSRRWRKSGIPAQEVDRSAFLPLRR